MTRRHWLIVLLVGAVALRACFNIQRPHKEVSFYQIEYEPPEIVGVTHRNVVLRLASFDVAPSYQSQKILYSPSPLKRKIYDYHLWVVNPGDMITDLLMRDLIASGHYQAVIDIDPNYATAYFDLGSIYLRQRNFSHCKRVWGKFLQLKPNSARAQQVRQILSDLESHGR